MDPGAHMAMIVEDARERHKAQFELVRFIDQQAMTMLGLYTTLAVAAASGFGASLGKDAAIPVIAGYALLAAAIGLIAGSACCFRVLSSADVGMPGREPSFWEWATQNVGLSSEDVLAAYLRQLREASEVNSALNAKSSKWFRLARVCGMAAPVLAAIVSLVAWKAQL